MALHSLEARFELAYFNELEGRIWLLIVYAKAKFDNLPAAFLAKLKYEVEHG